MKNLIYLFIFITLCAGCNNDSGTDTEEALRIRLANKSQYLYESIRVNTSTGSVSFGDLSAMQESAYKEFELAYRYAFIELEIGGVIFTIQPIDYVGETPLENGKYTYEIRANASQNRYGKLSLSLVKDE